MEKKIVRERKRGKTDGETGSKREREREREGECTREGKGWWREEEGVTDRGGEGFFSFLCRAHKPNRSV